MLPDIFFKILKKKKKLILYKKDSLIFELGKKGIVVVTNSRTNEIEIFPNMREAYHVNRKIIEKYENTYKKTNYNNYKEKIVYGKKEAL